MIPFTKNFDIVPFIPFVDYRSGIEYTFNTRFYWKPFSEMFFNYVNNKEEKFEGDIGKLQRKHIKINEFQHIGKETNNLEETEIIGVQGNEYISYKNIDENLRKIITNLSQKDIKRIGISRRMFFYLKNKIKKGNKIKFKKKTLRKVLNIQ